MIVFNRLKNLNTLLVDDDEFIRDALKTVFAAKGCPIRVAEAVRIGISAFIEKPFSVKKFVEQLDLAVKRQPNKPLIAGRL